MPPSHTSSLTEFKVDSQAAAMRHSDSNGFIQLEAGDERRKQGTTMIARQIEQENMKARQINAVQRASEKNLEIQSEQKMNQFLDKVNFESHQAEQWHSNHKKNQMRDNIEESLRLRETTDVIMAANLIKKETQLNTRLFTKSPTKKMGSPVK